MGNDFKEIMSQRSDNELIKIVTVEREKYNFIAIEAAELEIQKRNIDISNLAKIKEEVIIEKVNNQKTHIHRVSSITRLLNFLIDLFVLMFIMITIGYLLDFFVRFLDQNYSPFLSYVLFFSIYILYYIIMEVNYQKTVGKYMTGTRVVNLNGTKPKKIVIIARSLYRLIPFDRLSFLFVKNGIHDYLSQTTVVSDKIEMSSD